MKRSILGVLYSQNRRLTPWNPHMEGSIILKSCYSLIVHEAVLMLVSRP